MINPGNLALIVGLLAVLLAASVLVKFPRRAHINLILLHMWPSMLTTLFPLLLTIVTLALLAWSIFLGSAQSSNGRIGLVLGALGVIGLLAFRAGRQRSSHKIMNSVLQETLNDPLPEQQLHLRYDRSRLFWPFNVSHKNVERIRDLSYGPAGVRNHLDIYRPRDQLARSKPLPVLIQIHGSGWMMLSKYNQALPLINHMVTHGWVVVSINYRLSPAARFPAHLEDVKLAIAWVRRNIANYGGDPNFIALTGGSAGGHLVALAALTAARRELQEGFEEVDTSVNAAVPFYGKYDFFARDDTEGFRKAFIDTATRFIMPGTPEALPELWKLASPIAQVHADAPPFFIIHGNYDTIVPVEGARTFASALRAISRESVAYAELPGLQHAFDFAHSPATESTIHAVRQFLEVQYRRYLGAQAKAHPSPKSNEYLLR